MPTYEYECKKCQKTHEIFHSMTAKPIKKCPRCGGALKRLISRGSGFLFKGSGFYITDYRSKSYRDAKKRDESRQQSGAGRDEQSSKPAASSDSKPSSSTPKTDK